MDNQKTNVLVIGLIATGSSAVIDLLREYEEVHIIPGEFNDFRAPGLVADQLSNSETFDSPNEIRKLTGFKNKLRLLYSVFPLFQLNVNVLKGFNKRLNYSLTRIRQITLLSRLNKELTSVNSMDEKIRHLNQWIRKTGEIKNKDRQFVVFNQPLLPANNIGLWRIVFTPFKLIVVYRNPYDQFAEIVQRGNLLAPYNAPYLSLGSVIMETIYGRSRKSAFKFHIEAMNKRNDWIGALKSKLNKDELLLVDFDDLARDNDNCREKIQKFLGITGPLSKKGMYFDTMRAKCRVNFYKNILSDEEISLLSGLNKCYLDYKGK